FSFTSGGSAPAESADPTGAIFFKVYGFRRSPDVRSQRTCRGSIQKLRLRTLLPTLPPQLLLVCLAGISTGNLAIPSGMMSPGPFIGHRASNHRMKCPRLLCRPFVYVDDEASQHRQCRDVVQDIADSNQHPAKNFREPHEDPRKQEHCRRPEYHPKIHLLARVEESDVRRLELLLVQRVFFHSPQPPAIAPGPAHRLDPVEKLERKSYHEADAKPWVQKPGHCSPAKQRRQELEKPRRIDPHA